MPEPPLLVRHGVGVFFPFSLFYFFIFLSSKYFGAFLLPLFQGINGHAPGLGALNHNKEPDPEMGCDNSQQTYELERIAKIEDRSRLAFLCTSWLVPDVKV